MKSQTGCIFILIVKLLNLTVQILDESKLKAGENHIDADFEIHGGQVWVSTTHFFW